MPINFTYAGLLLYVLSIQNKITIFCTPPAQIKFAIIHFLAKQTQRYSALELLRVQIY